MRRGYVDGPYGQIHYSAALSGRPLVLLHQAPMSLRQFDSVYPLFTARGFRPIGIDLPGFGLSDPTSFVPRIEDWARIIAPVLEALSIDKADLLGHHTGALVAAAFAASQPERTRSLVMHAVLLPTEEERRAALARVEANERNFTYHDDGSHLAAAFLLRKRLHGGPADPRLLTRYVVEQFMGLGPFWHGHHAAWQFDLRALLERLPERTLVVTNTGDVIHEMSQRILTLRPGTRIATLTGGGVDIVDEQPEGWVSLICGYLTEEAA